MANEFILDILDTIKPINYLIFILLLLSKYTMYKKKYIYYYISIDIHIENY